MLEIIAVPNMRGLNIDYSRVNWRRIRCDDPAVCWLKDGVVIAFVHVRSLKYAEGAAEIITQWIYHPKGIRVWTI